MSEADWGCYTTWHGAWDLFRGPYERVLAKRSAEGKPRTVTFLLKLGIPRDKNGVIPGMDETWPDGGAAWVISWHERDGSYFAIYQHSAKPPSPEEFERAWAAAEHIKVEAK